MKDLRTLLIDCRIELRKYVRDFHKTELCERLDLAIQSTTGNQPAVPAAGGEAPADAAPVDTGKAGKLTTSQVALAWQTAARDIRFSDPALYGKMSEKVMRLLETKTLVDPATELKQLGDEVEALKAVQQTHAATLSAIERERDTLLGALADAVPDLTDSGDKLAVALARVEWLKAHGAAASKGGGSAGGGGRAAPAGPPPEGPVPTNEILQAVAAGARGFSKEQREWCVGEAMVLSGFQYTPVELIEQGDTKMANIILAARKG